MQCHYHVFLNTIEHKLQLFHFHFFSSLLHSNSLFTSTTHLNPLFDTCFDPFELWIHYLASNTCLTASIPLRFEYRVIKSVWGSIKALKSVCTSLYSWLLIPFEASLSVEAPNRVDSWSLVPHTDTILFLAPPKCFMSHLAPRLRGFGFAWITVVTLSLLEADEDDEDEEEDFEDEEDLAEMFVSLRFCMVK